MRLLLLLTYLTDTETETEKSGEQLGTVDGGVTVLGPRYANTCQVGVRRARSGSCVGARIPDSGYQLQQAERRGTRGTFQKAGREELGSAALGLWHSEEGILGSRQSCAQLWSWDAQGPKEWNLRL